jgi:hypothetical protein
LARSASGSPPGKQWRDEHEPQVVWLKADPRFKTLRADPRYDGLLKRLNLN